ncbi:MAG: transcription termination factor NusA [Candidatus Fermentibacteraceae bacterium]|nr:transcription termination factor NusA [Candidatus Fermentibacteraceae bacterium]MBN2608683.1 transcription termination factor NusA [Candidatus Fermentibacteraceae bacterium]
MSENYQRIEALAAVIRESKGANQELLLEWLRKGLLEATEREFGTPQNIRVTWNQKTDDVTIVAVMEVVKEVDPEKAHLQITRRRARKYEPDAEIGDEVGVPLDFDEFGRSAINVFRREFHTLEKSAEREKVYEEYSGRMGQLIPRCVVQQVYKNRVNVRVAGQIDAVIPPKERARGERFEHGDTVLPVLVEVLSPESTEPQLVLSRATPILVKRLFEREAPEIDEGVVQIKAIAREAGVRTKIAVASNDIRIDAVGTFVGMKGMRVQSVMRELNGERIDIIPWTIDRKLLVTNALLPATVLRVKMEKSMNTETGEEETVMIATVPDDEIGRAKGKGGHNVRLAGKLVGCRIEVEEKSVWDKRKQWEDMLRIDISEFDCVSDKLAERLTRAGFDSADTLIGCSVQRLMEVQGVGPVTAESLLKEAKKLIRARKKLVEEKKEEARLNALEMEKVALEIESMENELDDGADTEVTGEDEAENSGD